jgi:hypothetical protein
MEPEILVTISFRLPQTDRMTLYEHLGKSFKEAIQAGGDTVTISLQPYTPDE